MSLRLTQYRKQLLATKKGAWAEVSRDRDLFVTAGRFYVERRVGMSLRHYFRVGFIAISN